MYTPSDKPRCKAITKSSLPGYSCQCELNAKEGFEFCPIHLGRTRNRIAKSGHAAEIVSLIALDMPVTEIHKILKSKGFEVNYVNLTLYVRKMKTRMGLF